MIIQLRRRLAVYFTSHSYVLQLLLLLLLVLLVVEIMKIDNR